MREYFPKLIGNEATKARIGRAIVDGRAPHAFLIGGLTGSGKSVLATEIAAAINCERRTEDGYPLPCGECRTCKLIYEGNFTDVKTLKRLKDKATLGVDLIKDAREDMFLSSTESDYKVYIIDEAETMTPEAQNALLKVLEEPPKGVFILLLAKECDRILTTIKSRTQYIPMSRFSKQEISEFLLKKSEEARSLYRMEKARFNGILMSADGRLGLALSLTTPKASSDNDRRRKEAAAVIEAASGRGSFADIFSAVKALPEKRAELMPVIEELMSACRDLIVLKETDNAPLVFFPTKEEALHYSESIDIKKLLSLFDALCQAQEYCQKNVNATGILANLMSRIKAGGKQNN